MRNPFPHCLALLLSLSLLFAACGKKEDAAPLPGAISGQVTPAGSATSVTATDAAAHAKTTTPGSNGDYRIEQLAAGTYTLSFTPAPNYTPVPSQTLTVVAGQTTTAAATSSSVLPGSIIGSITYGAAVNFAGIVPTITATDATLHATVVAPAANGQYTFNSLAPGTYTLTYASDPDFAPIAAQTVAVRSAGIVSATTVPLALLTTSSFAINGTAAVAPSSMSTTYPYSFPTANTLVLIAATTANSMFQQIDVHVGGFTGATGTYPLSSSNNYADLRFTPIGGTTQGWVVDQAQGGAIIITAVKANPRRVSGSFGFVVKPSSGGATGTKPITGTFSNLLY